MNKTQEQDIAEMQLDLQDELSKLLFEFGVNIIDQYGKTEKKIELTKTREKITNLFKKYKEVL